jgi:WXG100 family type VII secretion target
MIDIVVRMPTVLSNSGFPQWVVLGLWITDDDGRVIHRLPLSRLTGPRVAYGLSRWDDPSDSEEVYEMAGFKVTPQQLSTLGIACNRTAVDVRGQHSALRGQLAPLFGTDWSGAAAAQFADLYDQFNTNAQGMSEALDGIGRLLGQAGQSYASVEQQIASSFRH